MTAATPLSKGPFVPLRQPFVGIDSLRAIIGVNEDKILALVEDGRLRWVFNVAAPGARRRVLRVWVQSVLSYLEPHTHGNQEGFTPRSIAMLTLPPYAERDRTIYSNHLRGILNVASMHVNDLILKGALQTKPGSIWRRGEGGSPVVTVDSYIKFLEERVVR